VSGETPEPRCPSCAARQRVKYSEDVVLRRCWLNPSFPPYPCLACVSFSLQFRFNGNLPSGCSRRPDRWYGFRMQTVCATQAPFAQRTGASSGHNWAAASHV